MQIQVRKKSAEHYTQASGGGQMGRPLCNLIQGLDYGRARQLITRSSVIKQWAQELLSISRLFALLAHLEIAAFDRSVHSPDLFVVCCGLHFYLWRKALPGP